MFLTLADTDAKGKVTPTPYTARKDAAKAASRFRSLIGSAVAESDKLANRTIPSGSIVTVTGKHPTAANAFATGLYLAPYAAPKTRKPRTPKAE